MVAALFVSLCAVQIWSLQHSAKPLSDEGVYLYAAKLIAAGATPYKNFLLVHPPGAILAIAGFFKLFGIDLVLLRAVYVILCQSVMLPIYMIVRRRSVDIWPALCALAAWIGFVQLQHHDTRFVALRVVALIPLAWGLWLGLDGRRPPAAFLAGLFVSLTVFITFSVVFITAPLALGLLYLHRRARRHWGWLLAGMIAGAIPLLLTFTIPRAWECLIEFHANRVRFPWPYRRDVLWIVVGSSPAVFALWLIGMLNGKSRDVRLIGLANLFAIAAVFAVPRSNAMHYYNILGVTLAVSAGLGVAALSIWGQESNWRRLYGAAVALSLFMMIILQFAAVCLPDYCSKEGQGYHDLIAQLRRCEGPLMTIEPIYALDAGLDIPGHYYVADIRALKDSHENLPPSAYIDLLNASRYYLEEKHSAERFQPEVHDFILTNFELVYANPWGRIFRNPNYMP